MLNRIRNIDVLPDTSSLVLVLGCFEFVIGKGKGEKRPKKTNCLKTFGFTAVMTRYNDICKCFILKLKLEFKT